MGQGSADIMTFPQRKCAQITPNTQRIRIDVVDRQGKTLILWQIEPVAELSTHDDALRFLQIMITMRWGVNVTM